MISVHGLDRAVDAQALSTILRRSHVLVLALDALLCLFQRGTLVYRITQQGRIEESWCQLSSCLLDGSEVGSLFDVDLAVDHSARRCLSDYRGLS